MSQYILTISYKGKLEKQVLTAGKKWVIKAQPGAEYQIEHSDEEVLDKITAEMEQNNLVINLANEEIPTVIIEDYGLYYSKDVAVAVSENSAHFGATDKLLASAMVTDATSFSATNVAIGVGSVVGTALLGHSLFHRKHSSSPQNESAENTKDQTVPEVKEESKNNPNKTDEIPVESKQEEANNSTSQPNKPVEKDNETVLKPDNTEKPTEIKPPIMPTTVKIALDPIAQNDLINSANLIKNGEKITALMISGKVTYEGPNPFAKTGDLVTLTVGESTFSGALHAEDGELRFNIEVNTQNLLDNQRIIAKIEGQDESGNTQTATTSREYTVDVTLTQPTITLDPITANNDDVINQKEAAISKTTLRGKVANIDNDVDSPLVSVEIAGEKRATTYDATTQTWSLEVNTAELVALAKNGTEPSLTAHIEVTDHAGNTQSNQAVRSFKVDTVLNDPVLTFNEVTDHNIINSLEAKATTTTLSGKVELDEDADLNKVVITVAVGEEKLPATFNKADKSWSLAVETSKLIALTDNAEGQKSVTATITVEDTAGNTQTATTSREYTVDVSLTQPTITLDPITANDDVINQKEAAISKTTLRGKVANIDNDVDSPLVSVEIAGEKRPAIYDAKTQTWSLEVNTAELVALAKNGVEPSLTAHIAVTDHAGNTQSNQAVRSFKVDTVLNDPVLTFNEVTDHNIINALEAKAKTTTLSGTVELDEDINLDKVAITVAVGEEKLPVTFNKADKSWSLAVETSKLIALTDNAEGQKSVTATVSAEDKAGNQKEISTEHKFSVEKPTTIDIDHIGQNFSASLSKSTRLSGVIEFDGAYAVGKNNYQVKWINLKIGEKTYSAGFNSKEKSFFIDIDNAELSSLHGKAISVDFVNPSDSDHAPKMFAYKLEEGGAGDYAIRKAEEMPTVKTLTLTTSDNNASIVNNGDNNYSVNKPTIDTIAISGTVSGNAKENDIVEITIGQKSYSTKVTAGNTFSMNVAAQDLQQGGGKVTATLKAKDPQGNAIEAMDIEHYAQLNTVKADYVTQYEQVKDPKTDHTKIEYNFPYFIKQIMNGLEIDKSAFGETRIVKYQFIDVKDIVNGQLTTATNPQIQGLDYTESNSFVDYSEAHKDTIRAAYNRIGEFINVQFVEVPTSEKILNVGEGTRLFRAKLTGSFQHSAAFAFNDGDLIWNDSPDWHSGDGTNTFTSYTALHEIAHTLWMAHPHEQTGAPKPQMEFEDNREFTNMSYNANSSIDYRSLRLFDLAALHYRYGVNKTQRTGNDVYSFKDYNITSADGGLYIWDGGGVDTFDASAEKQGVNVNLTPGSWIYRGEELSPYFMVKGTDNFTRAQFFEMPEDTDFYTNFEEVDIKLPANEWFKDKDLIHKNPEYTKGQAFIGYGTQIENLIGSDLDDVLTGNKADNNIQGGRGDDIIKGDAGNDYLDGGAGNDSMLGGAGDDTYFIDSTLDQVIEQLNQGTDTILSLVDYTLTDNVENLQLLGTTATQARGNALDNMLTANNIGNHLNGGDGNDRLIGGLGEDILTGGNGSDVFVFNTMLNGTVDTITDFNIAEDTIALSKAIFNITADNVRDHIKYDTGSGQLSYDSDTQGSSVAVHFANLAANLDEQMIRYEIV